MVGHYFLFPRTCKQALEFYQEALGLEVTEMQTYGDMPPGPGNPEVAESDNDLVLHARCMLDGSEIMCADTTSLREEGNIMFISITTPDEAYVRSAWDALAKDGEVYMDLQSSFFAAAHGSLQDKFGVNWMFTALAQPSQN